MKVFFTTPYAGKRFYQKYIDETVKAIESTGAEIVSPEKTEQKTRAYEEGVKKLGSLEMAHYEFIRQGIADADAVIFEATYEDFRVGHETTLALAYGKPVLVLSQKIDYSQYIPHEKLVGTKYSTKSELKKTVVLFLESVKKYMKQEYYQVIDDVADLQRSITLSKFRYTALQGKSYFADWARGASRQPGKVYREILDRLGNLPIQKPWEVFAKIYHEDTPDNVFYGTIKFVDNVFRNKYISKADPIVDVACGTGSVSRLMTSFGYKHITAFDKSRAMLAEAYRLCAHIPSIKIMEADIKDLKLDKLARGMIWTDFSSNFALEEKELESWISNLLNNLEKDGVLIFDIRTKTGWNKEFFRQRVTAYETENFQRLWINLRNQGDNKITFDIFIRLKDKTGSWLPWEREQMTERMWKLSAVKKIVNGIKTAEVEGIYGDDFKRFESNSPEPGLAYFVLRKT